MRSESFCSWICLRVCVCVGLLSHISPLERLLVLKLMSFTRQRRWKFCGIFSEIAPLQRSSTCCIAWLSVQLAIFTPWKSRTHIIQPHLVNCLHVSSCSYIAKMQSCSASDSSKNRVDTPPAKQQSMCESLFANQRACRFVPRVLHFSAFISLAFKLVPANNSHF